MFPEISAPPWKPTLAKTLQVLVAFILPVTSLSSTPSDSARPIESLGLTSIGERPNIIFILADDARWDDLSITGNKILHTPNIDRIGSEGAVFHNAYVTTPLCVPSRASFLTGQYAHTHGIKISSDQENNARSFQLMTFPLLLQRSGYETAFLGKWHVGNDSAPRPGFDRWVSFKGQGVYVDPVLNIDGKEEQKNGFLTDMLNQYADEFIRRSHAKPFLLYLSHKAPHAPSIPADRYKDLFAGNVIVRAVSVSDDLAGKPVLRRPGITISPTDSDTQTTDENIRDRLRSLLAIDDGVKQIFAALQATNQLERTLIVFTSDNGYFYGEHGLGGKHGAYEESIRIPLLLRYPGVIKPGSAFAPFILSIDLAPTLLEAAKVPSSAGMQGRSFLSLLRGEAYAERSAFLTEFFLGRGSTNRFPDWQAVRNSRYKYIHYPAMDGMDELYDLNTDPLEMKNIITDPAAAERLQKMKARLSRLLESTK